MARLFISSTFRDLSEHRTVVFAALRKAGHEPIAMEDFTSQDGDAKAVSLDELHSCQLFIGIYAHRYGYRPDGGRSVTEMEYDEAERLSMPRLVFIVADSFADPVIDANRETSTDGKVLLRIFKERLRKTRVADEFTSPEDLAYRVLASVSRFFEKRQAADKSAQSQPNIQQGDNSVYQGHITQGDHGINQGSGTINVNQKPGE